MKSEQKTEDTAIKQSEIDVNTKIRERIFTVRGRQVMIDKDLALLYGVETKRLNEQVKRNIERFPEDFMFQLTIEECLRSQIATLNQAWPASPPFVLSSIPRSASASPRWDLWDGPDISGKYTASLLCF